MVERRIDVVYNSQMGAIVPQGIKKKKLNMAPIVQEQAQQGIATQLVSRAKENQQYEAERAFQERELQMQQKQWERDFEQRKKQNDYQNTIGGISTALEIVSLFM